MTCLGLRSYLLPVALVVFCVCISAFAFLSVIRASYLGRFPKAASLSFAALETRQSCLVEPTPCGVENPELGGF